MNDRTRNQQSAKDRLLARPGDPLPAALDPDSPEARGYPVNPKPVPPTGQGDPEATRPAPKDIDRPA